MITVKYFRLLGRISTVTTVSNTRIIYAAELPLESLCKQHQDTFLLPDTLNSNGPITDDSTGIIKPTGIKETSLTETLLNIPRNPQVLFYYCGFINIRWALILVVFVVGPNHKIKYQRTNKYRCLLYNNK